MQVIFERQPFTPWVIEIIRNQNKESDEDQIEAERGIIGASGDFEEFTGIYRTASLDGQNCEQFTILPLKGPDLCLIQIQVFKNGDVWNCSHIPCQVRVNRKNKKIIIDILAKCKLTEKGTIEIIPIIE